MCKEMLMVRPKLGHRLSLLNMTVFLEAVSLSRNEDEIKVSFHHILSSKRGAAAACRWLWLQQHLYGVQHLLVKRGSCAANIASFVYLGG